MKKILATLCLLLLAGSAQAADIPVDTWIAIRNATNLTGASFTAALYEKHMTAAYSPKTKRLYFNGGDTHKHFIGPNGADFGSASYYQGTHSLDLGSRLASPGNPNAGTATEHAYCSSGTEVQPKRPDFVGFQWVPWLDRFMLLPGEFESGTSANCPGETPAFGDDPNYAFRKIMTFDTTSKKWAVLSANHGARYTGNDYPWHFVADPVTKRLIRVEYNGDLVADHYDPATDQWVYYSTGGNGLNCSKSHLAIIDRTLYCADRESGKFGAYKLDSHTASVVGPLPGSVLPGGSVPADKGYLFGVGRKIVYAELDGTTWGSTFAYRIWMWSPDAPVWSRIDTLPWKTLDGEVLPAGEMPRGTSGAVDTDLGVLYLTGQYGGTANYSWAIKLSGYVPPQPPPVTPPAPPPVQPPPVQPPPVQPPPVQPPPVQPPTSQKPALNRIAPSPVASGRGGFNLAVTGTGFVSGLTATVGGQARTVVFGSATQATIGVLAADLVKVGNVAVQVTNPGYCGATGTPGVCASNAMQLVVTPPVQAPNPKITIEVTPPDCIDVSVNGVLIPGSCPASATR